MTRHSARKAIKHMLHEDGATGSRDAEGNPYGNRVHKKIIPTKDISINRENPNRKLSNSNALVVGYHGRGNFLGVMPHGHTHGYWTLNVPSDITVPDDGAGSSGDYVARTIIEFDLNDSGLTSGDDVDSALLYLYYYMSNTIREPSISYNFDFYRMHPGGITNTSQNLFTENATWWEYDFSGTATLGSTGSFGETEVGTHGTNLWDNQGLGITGSTAEHNSIPSGTTTQWLDISGGVSGSNQDDYSDNLYKFGHKVSRSDIVAGNRIQLDITDAVIDALNNYDNKLRIFIKLRDDHLYDTTENQVFISFFAKEIEPTPDKINAKNISQYSPCIHITYWDSTG